MIKGNLYYVYNCYCISNNSCTMCHFIKQNDTKSILTILQNMHEKIYLYRMNYSHANKILDFFGFGRGNEPILYLGNEIHHPEKFSIDKILYKNHILYLNYKNQYQKYNLKFIDVKSIK